MENRLAELFPVESIGPLLGGVLIWFAVNYLYIGPELIGPRLAAKYYGPACLAAVQDGREARTNEVASLRQAFQQQQAALAQSLQQQMQAATSGFFGALLGGRPGSDEFFRQHGNTVQGWSNSMAGMATPAIQQRLQREEAAFRDKMEEREREAKKGILYASPVQFCGCVITEGMKERIDLAAFTATLRLYTPPAIKKLGDGTMLHEAKACGSPPMV